MKLLFLVPALGPVYGGPSKTVPALAAALSRRCWSVDIVTTNANGAEILPVPLDQWIEQDGYRAKFFSCSSLTEYKLSRRLLGWLLNRVKDYDLVHINSDFNFPVLAGALACQLRRVPYVITPHGMLEPWALSYKARKKRAYFSWIEQPLILRRARAIQALNAQEAANIGALKLGPPVVILPNGINWQDERPCDAFEKTAFFERFPATKGKTLILFMHRIDPKKGLDLLARAFAKVRAKFPQAHVIVAGPDSTNFSDTARRFFEQAGCGDGEAVTFTGMLDGGMRRAVLGVADIFVAPSYSEGFSMSVLEAMVAGLPCVITTGCNFPEAAEAGAAKVVPIEADAIATALMEVVGNLSAGRIMGDHARRLVLDKYTWDSIAARFEEVVRPPFLTLKFS